MSSSACLSLHRAHVGRRRLSKVFRAFQPFRLSDGLGAVSGIETSSLRSSAGKKKAAPASPSRRLHSLAKKFAGSLHAKWRHASAAPWPDSPALCPLHSVALSASMLAGAARTYADVSLVPTAANRRDRMKPGAPKDTDGREASPAKTAALTVRSAISAPPPFRKLHCGGQKQPTSLTRPGWSDTSPLDFAACRLGCHSPFSRPSFRYVPSSRSQQSGFRAGATTPGTSPQPRHSERLATRRRCMKECYPDSTQEMLSVMPPIAVSAGA